MDGCAVVEPVFDFRRHFQRIVGGASLGAVVAPNDMAGAELEVRTHRLCPEGVATVFGGHEFVRWQLWRFALVTIPRRVTRHCTEFLIDAARLSPALWPG